jgi:hypothetical protein
MLLYSKSLEVANPTVIRATRLELRVDHKAPTQSEATTNDVVVGATRPELKVDREAPTRSKAMEGIRALAAHVRARSNDVGKGRKEASYWLGMTSLALL